MANFFAFYPPGNAGGSNPSVGTTGSTAPTSATEIGGIDTGTGDLTGINSTNGNLNVNVESNPSPINTNGSYSQITNLTTSAQTFTKPANAIGFLLEAESGNTVNIRWRIGAAATTSAGMLMEPGRDSGFIPCAANVSVIAVSGSNQSIGIQWVMSS